jgi:hypothetical protein
LPSSNEARLRLYLLTRKKCRRCGNQLAGRQRRWCQTCREASGRARTGSATRTSVSR